MEEQVLSSEEGRSRFNSLFGWPDEQIVGEWHNGKIKHYCDCCGLIIDSYPKINVNMEDFLESISPFLWRGNIANICKKCYNGLIQLRKNESFALALGLIGDEIPTER